MSLHPFPVRQAALRIASSLLVVLSASCGGGGGGGGGGSSTSASPPPPVAASITGYVDEGPVSGATVKLYKVDAAGTKTLLGSATTDSRGFYSVTNSAPANTSVLIEANGGTYTDELTNQTLTLSIPLRAATTSNGGAAMVSVTPYSEVAVRILEHAATPDWSATGIASANTKVATNIGTTQFLDFIPVNLMVPPPTSGVRDNDLGLSFITSGFSGYAARVDANPSTSLASGLDGLYKLFAVDEHDDKLLPAFLGGITDFVDRSAASDVSKKQLKSLLLLGQVTSTITDADLNRYKPTGTSSGSASAPMPDDAFQVVGVQAAGSMFNQRGALIAYPLDDGSAKWRALFTASVAEVYGDGDIGIGRWNGGATIDSTRAGAELNNAASAQLIPYGSFHYGVARPATNVPACGMRRLALVGATLPTLASEAVGAQAQALGLTADSSVSFQYGSDTLAGFDIGVRAADGSVTRYTSVGGAAAPSSSTIHLSNIQSSQAALQPSAGTSLSAIGMDVQGLASGNGGTKLVLKLVLGRNLASRTELVAAFAAANPTVDGSGCAVSIAGAPFLLGGSGG